MHVPVERDVIAAFENDQGPGPDPENLQFDLNTGPESLWNEEVINELVERLKKLQEETDESLPECSDEIYRHYLKNKYNTLRSHWTALKPRQLPGHMMETVDQAGARVVNRVNTHMIESRRRGRRLRVGVNEQRSNLKAHLSPCTALLPTA
jgi:hypothetical protein